MGAGTGASNNLVASLRSSLPSVVIVGCNHDPFTLKKSTADRNYLASYSVSSPDEVLQIAAAEVIDLVLPTGDGDVSLLSDHRERFGRRVYLPPKDLIDLCQDKYDLAVRLAQHDVPVPVSVPLSDRTSVEEAIARLGGAPRLWCRMRAGTRSIGATPVVTAAHVRGWLLLWKELRGVPAAAFMLAEYLPGRDFLCQGLWQHGRLVHVKTFERISYFGGENSPSGVSSLSSLAKTVFDPRIVDVCTRAVQLLDPEVQGAFSIDLKENAAGVPCITEINAGRFFIGMTALDRVGQRNMTEMFVRLALGDDIGDHDPYDCPADHYLVRDLDTLPTIFTADDLFAGLLQLQVPADAKEQS